MTDSPLTFRASDRYLRTLNDLLHAPERTPIQAYALGAVSMMVHQQLGKTAPPALLEKVSRCVSLKEAESIGQSWIDSHQPT